MHLRGGSMPRPPLVYGTWRLVKRWIWVIERTEGHGIPEETLKQFPQNRVSNFMNLNGGSGDMAKFFKRSVESNEHLGAFEYNGLYGGSWGWAYVYSQETQ